MEFGGYLLQTETGSAGHGQPLPSLTESVDYLSPGFLLPLWVFGSSHGLCSSITSPLLGRSLCLTLFLPDLTHSSGRDCWLSTQDFCFPPLVETCFWEVVPANGIETECFELFWSTVV